MLAEEENFASLAGAPVKKDEFDSRKNEITNVDFGYGYPMSKSITTGASASR